MMAALVVLVFMISGTSDGTVVRVGSPNCHKTFGIIERGEAELRVKSVGIQRGEHEPPQALQSRMRLDRGHQPFAQTPAAVCFEDKNIRQPGKRGGVGDDAGEAGLLAADINAEAKGMIEGALDRFAWDAGGPITLLAE